MEKTKDNGLYLRLSLSDGDLGKDGKEESNSIENQRALLHGFLEEHPELGEGFVEYVDDGYTGTNFERPAFQRMIEDAKSGKIQTVIVKDLSRFGRDYIIVGDYLEQVFPLLGIRFIALNSNYDSDNYLGKTMGMDMAISNLVNTLYSRDISRKMKSANRIRWRQGISTQGKPPFGYLRDKADKRKWVIDPEAGKYVRIIFEKAMEGYNTKQIANFMNEQKIPTPGRYNELHNLRQSGYNRKLPEKEILWESCMVRVVLSRYEYTGALVAGKRQNIRVGSNATRKSIPRDVVITKNIYPPIVTEEEYELAKATIRFAGNPVFKGKNKFPLKGKIRCGNCHRMLAVSGAYEKLYCPHKYGAGSFAGCAEEMCSVPVVEGNVCYVLQKNLKVLKQVQECRSKGQGAVHSEQKRCRDMEAEIEHLKGERIRSYEAYAMGRITRGDYVKQKEQASVQICQLQKEKDLIEIKMKEKNQLSRQIQEAVDDIEECVERKKLTEEIVGSYIDVVYVYDKKHIEVVLKFEDGIKQAMEELESQEDAT